MPAQAVHYSCERYAVEYNRLSVSVAGAAADGVVVLPAKKS
jgi:hypothetical protein